MAKMVFKVNGGGDMSVGIPDTHATVTVEDNYKEVNKTQQELFREFLREFYDIPKHRGAVLTLEEYEKEQEQEQKYYDEMKKEYEDTKKREEQEEQEGIDGIGDLGLITDMDYPITD